MEKKLANMEMNKEALNEVSGGMIHDGDGLGVMQRNLTAQKGISYDFLIDNDKDAILGADARAKAMMFGVDEEAMFKRI